MSERKKITADLVLDMYLEAKKTRGVKKEDLMKYFNTNILIIVK